MKRQYVMTIISSLLECFLFCNLALGWPSMQYVFIQSGYFSDMCKANVTSNQTSVTVVSCDSQNAMFGLVFTIAMGMYGLSPFPVGFILDYYGTRVFRIVASCLCTLGLLCLALSSETNSWLVFPGLSLVTVGGVSIFMGNVQVGNLSKNAKPLYIAILNGVFDSSASVMLVFQLLYDNGLNYMAFLYTLTGASVFIWLNTFLLMPRRFIPDHLPVNFKYGYSEIFQNQEKNISGEGISETYANREETKVEVAKNFPTFLECLKDFCFWTFVLSASVLNFRVLFSFGSLYDLLSVRVEPHQLGFYLKVFNSLMMFGVFGSPLNGFVIQFCMAKFRKTQPEQIATSRALFVSAVLVNILGLCLSVTVLIPGAEYVYFGLLFLFRAFLYSLVSAYMSMMYPAEYFGKICGIVYTASGIVMFLQYPLLRFAATYDHDHVITNCCMLAACIIVIVHPITLWVTACRNKNNTVTPVDI